MQELEVRLTIISEATFLAINFLAINSNRVQDGDIAHVR